MVTEERAQDVSEAWSVHTPAAMKSRDELNSDRANAASIWKQVGGGRLTRVDIRVFRSCLKAL